jgi:hypothetical protein
VSRWLLALGVAGAALAGCTHAGAGAPAAGAQPASASAGDCYRVESERFVFHGDPWINLHHFLFQWARDGAERSPEDHRRAVEVPEKAQLGDLGHGERQSWQRAVDFYRERLIARPLLFDRDLIALRDQLAAIACSPAGPETLDPEVRTVLVDAMPVYRRHWWPGHDAANKAWIQEEMEELKRFEAPLAGRLAEVYGGEWPPERIRVDVVAYANWAGAYTTNHPDHITIAGPSYEGLAGVEILFHEVSHASFFEQRILGQVAAAFIPIGLEPPSRLFHAIQFATPAEILRSLLSDEERSGFRSVADGVYQRGPFSEQYQVVLTYWRPFLDGQVTRAQALHEIATELATRRPAG